MNRSIAMLVSGVLAVLVSCAPPAFGADLLPPVEALKPGRPRLLLRATDTPLAISLRQLSAGPKDAEFQALLAQLQGLRQASPQALVYRLTGKTEFADKAVAILKACQVNKGKSGDPFYVYFTLMDLALAYDWLHDYAGFDAQAKADLRQKLQPLAEAGLRGGNDHVFHNYVWMFNGGAMLWALATAGDDPAADKLYATLRDRFNRQLFGAMEYLEGSNGDSAGYWWLYCHNAAVMVLLAAQSGFETDLVGAIARDHGNWLARQYDYLLLSILPDMRFMPWGDIVGGPNGGVTHEMADKIDALAWALHSPGGAQVSRWLAAKRGPARFYGETAMYYFLYSRHLPAPPAEPPLGVLAGGKQGGHVIWRSDWTDNATVVGFRCTDFFGQHNHIDQGSFILFRHGLLALDAGQYKNVGGPQSKTDAHNTLLLGGQGQRTLKFQSAATLDAFTQRLTKGLETGDILFYKDAGPWAAAAGQFAQAYTPGAVQSCVRQLLYVRPGTVVVVDQLTGPGQEPLPEVRWLLHVPAKPTVDDQTGTVLASNGKSYLRCRPLTPGQAKPQIEDALRTSAGPKTIDASRVIFAYAGKPSLTLVHVLDVGDGPPGPAPAAKVDITAQAIKVTLEGKSYTFSSAAPFGVAADKP